MIKRTIASILAVTILGCSGGEDVAVVFSIKDIANASRQSVAAQLGDEERCEKNEYGERCSYKNGSIFLIFANNRVSRAEIHALGNLAFSPSSIAALGLKPKSPDFRSKAVIRWKGIEGLKEVNVFPDGNDRTSYAYVVVSE